MDKPKLTAELSKLYDKLVKDGKGIEANAVLAAYEILTGAKNAPSALMFDTSNIK